ncbi:MAG TPA: isoprenylcysteine carboxylmethyltransferase family protein [Bacilli bacterium]|nr:isoprenylcysteine carboxylmethyltransferase family protein [Bacilli bacterium]HPX84757.1 isoprenylcysteine carboxylmethyltransferase family protein [Bacilli bacterium]
MIMKLLIKALIKYVIALVIVGMLLFLPAGTFNYLNAWLFIDLLFIPMFVLGTILYIKAPSLLEKRLNAKEEENTQKAVVALSGALLILEFILAGLDFRWGWSKMPFWLIIVAAVLFLVFYVMYALIMKENAYLSRKVEVQENQKVIDTGFYRLVRHPMYAVSLLMFLLIPVILGSWWSLVCFFPYSLVIVMRIKNEEKVLEANLLGYLEYKQRVKYRLIPFIW